MDAQVVAVGEEDELQGGHLVEPAACLNGEPVQGLRGLEMRKGQTHGGGCRATNGPEGNLFWAAPECWPRSGQERGRILFPR
jgi:hypothetical protein